MARFLYRMQNILNIKEKLESQARMDYAAARQKLSEEEEKLAGLRVRKADYETQIREYLEESLNVKQIIELYQAVETMKTLIAQQKEQVARAEIFLEEQRIKLTEIMQERKTHEKLKEKAFEEFLQEENARENKEIDELTSYTYGRNKNRE